MRPSRLSKEAAGRLEPVRHGTFKYFVAQLNPNSAEDLGIDDLLNDDLAANLLSQSNAEPFPLGGGERLGDTDRCHDPILLRRGQRHVTLYGLPEGPLTSGHGPLREHDGCVGGAACQQPLDQLLSLAKFDRPV